MYKDLVIVTTGTLSLTPFNLKAQCLRQSFTGKKKSNQIKKKKKVLLKCSAAASPGSSMAQPEVCLQQSPPPFKGPGGYCQSCGATGTPSVIHYLLISLQQGPALAARGRGLDGTFPESETRVTAPAMSLELQLFALLRVR